LIDLAKRSFAGTAFLAAPRVQSAATKTANVHRSREPAGDKRAAAQDRDQDGSVQKKILQWVKLLVEPGTFNYD